MPCDAKTHQPVLASLPRDGERFCPECGQSLDLLAPSSVRQATARSWWTWILTALALYLAATFGVEAGGAQRLATVRLDDLRQVAPRCVSDTGVVPACYDDAATKGLDPLLARLARYAQAEGEVQRDVAVAVIGLLAALAGLGAAARLRSRATDDPQTSPRARPLRLALDLSGLGARALVPCAQLVLAASCGLAIARLLRGAPPSWELVSESIHRTIELVVAIAQNA